MKKVIIAILLLAFLSFTGYQIYKLHKRRLPREADVKIPVEVGRVGYQRMTWTLTLTGNIKPNQEVDVYPKVGGEILEKLLVERGDLVKAGDIIGIIEKERITARLNQARAALNSAKARLLQIEANLGRTKKDYERIKRLFTQGAISKQRLDHIEAEYEATLAEKKLAMAKINQAKATLNEVKIVYNNHNIIAPISGLITARYVDEGSMMDMKKPIVRITDHSLVKVMVNVTEREFPYVKIGQIAEVTVDAYPNKVFKGNVVIVTPRLDPMTRTGEVEVHIPNKEHLLRAGMFAHVRLILGEKRVLAVSEDALQKLPATGVYYLFTIKNGRAYAKNVKIGMREGKIVEVTSGIKDGEIVVIKGQNRLKEGAAVDIVGGQ